MKIKLIAFDVNGTLFDDTGIFWEAINGIFPLYGKERLPLEVLREKFGQPWTKVYREYGITEEMASDQELYRVYNQFYKSQEHPIPVSGLKETLTWLKDKGILLAIVSTQQNSITVPLLDKYNLTDFFFKISGEASDKSEVLKKLCAEVRIAVKDAAYVGDQEGDVRHAKAAGCVSVAFCGGLHDHERLKRMNPDFVIESMIELKDLSIF